MCAIMCVVLVSLFALSVSYVEAQKDSTGSQVKEVKDNAENHITDSRRTPQNLMTTGGSPVKWISVQNRVVRYTTTPQSGCLLADIISEIENNTCVIFIYMQTSVPSEAENQNKVCYIPDISQIEPKNKRLRFGFQCLFRCLGKYLEHQREDRDSYVSILSENILPGYYSKFQYIPKTVTQGLPYDFDSIMHLKHDAYSKNGLSTMVPLNDAISKKELGQCLYPSQQDYLDIKLTYCGTETAAGPVTVRKAGLTSISVQWPKPKYKPVKIRLDYQLSMLCEDEPYFKKRTYLPADFGGADFTEMKPGSLCTLNFAVIYNPSEFDRGVNYFFQTLPSKPTGPPKNVKLLWIKRTSAKLSWKAIPCPDQHGKILQYIVRYKYGLPDGTYATQEYETFFKTTETTLVNLRPNQNYFVTVAGVNQAGVGVFSLPIMIKTHRVCPGKVQITSIEATCNNVTIQWLSPLDEDENPYKVKLKFSYPKNHRTRVFGKLVAPSTETSLVVKNIPSDTEVKFSLAAITAQSKTGPKTRTSIKTKKNEETVSVRV